MKSASTTPNAELPETPPNDVTGDLDWARDDHAVAVVDARGREVVRRSVEHSVAGLAELIDVLPRAGCREVAIERPDGPVVDALLGAAPAPDRPGLPRRSSINRWPAPARTGSPTGGRWACSE